MLVEVKKCADKNDIKGLRYIFIDSLDVDPTFEKYQQDYNYCKGINGFFDEYTELTVLNMNSAEWNASYWDQLKRDLVKNFSQDRFEHMLQVAKVVYSDKIERLVSERAAKRAKVETQIESIIPTPINNENIVGHQNKTVLEENTEPRISINTQMEINDDSTVMKQSPLKGRTNGYSYKRVDDPDRIREIKKREYEWMWLGCKRYEWRIPQSVEQSYKYFVLRQFDKENDCYTGVVKLVEKTKATVKQWLRFPPSIEANREDDWIYYEKG